jgi:hypothetical protein
MPTGGRRFFADSRDATETVKVLRNGDGTGLVAVPAGGSLPAGERRLEFTFRRDNTAADPASQILRQNGSSDDEVAVLDVPWK